MKYTATAATIIFLCLFIFMSAPAGAQRKPPSMQKDRVLVFSLTKGFRHKSIPDGIAAIQRLGKENNFEADTTENPAAFNARSLNKYKAVIFLSPTGDSLFNEAQKSAFRQFIHRGGGFVGIHAATDCLFSWPWYGRLIGAYFTKHPPIQQAKLIITDTTHPSTSSLPSPWVHTDEWYNFRAFNGKVKILINLDESSYTGGDMGDFHPVSWYHNFEGGRVFYTALGHTEDCFKRDDLFLKHLLGGIQYALGRKK